MRRISLLVFFFLSGVSALLYQIAWVRQTTFTFGVSVHAYSAVIGAYMIGLALGSWMMGRRIDRRVRPLRTYALLEGGIAGLAALSPFLLEFVHGLYPTLANLSPPNTAALTLIRLVLALLVLTPVTFLIGATLPVMSRVYATQGGRIGRDVGRLYLVNTLGAASGCLLAGLVLLRFLGLRETIFLGAIINVGVAFGALALLRIPSPSRVDGPLDRGEQRSEEVDSPSVAPTAITGAAPAAALTVSARTLRYLGVAYGVSGFIALGYEVVWARILYIHTSHAVYSFTLMLTVYLTGLALGSAAGTVWLRRRWATLDQFGGIQLAIGLLGVLVLFIFAWLPALALDEWLGGYTVGYELLIAAITLLPPTFLLGALFPVVGSLYTRERARDVGLRIGRVNALNTAGAIAGSLGAGFVLIPLLGLQNTALLLAAGNLALGTSAIWLARTSTGPEPHPVASEPGHVQGRAEARPAAVGGSRWGRWLPIPATVLALVAALAVPPGLYLGDYYEEAEHLVFYEEGAETTVAVLDYPERNFKISFVNGRDEVPTDATSMRAFRLLGHLPALIQPRARNALVLSFGNGIATGTLATHDIPVIDAVDLSPEMIEAARIYSVENYDVRNNESVRLHVEDGRNFLLRTQQSYDIITVDATHPANASSWALFTREFYELVDEKLSDDGVFMQWIPLHALDESDYRAIIRTVWDVFPNTILWSTGGTHSYVVSTREPFTQSEFEMMLARAEANPDVQRDLGPRSAIARYVAMSGRTFVRYIGMGRIITDNNAFFLPMR